MNKILLLTLCTLHYAEHTCHVDAKYIGTWHSNEDAQRLRFSCDSIELIKGMNLYKYPVSEKENELFFYYSENEVVTVLYLDSNTVFLKYTYRDGSEVVGVPDFVGKYSRF